MSEKYISSWAAYTEGLGSILKDALRNGKIGEHDTVWMGPSRDYVVADSVPDSDEYMDYTDIGTVSEVLEDLG